MAFHPHCGICFEAYDDNCVLAAMQCGHVYHHNCLVKWFEERAVCPKCNHRETMPFLRRQLIPIYLDGQNEYDFARFNFDDPRPATNSHTAEFDWDNINWPHLLRTYIVPIVAMLVALVLFAWILGGSYAEAELKRLASNERYYVAEIKKLRAHIDQLKVDYNTSALPLCFIVLIAGIGIGRMMVDRNNPVV